MKRDLNLIRNILLEVESAEPEDQVRLDRFEEKYADRLNEVSAHVHLLHDAGYLKATISQELSPAGPRQFFIQKIEWEGYEYLDAVRDDGIWAKTQEKLKSVGGATTLEIAKAVATKLVMEAMGV